MRFPWINKYTSEQLISRKNSNAVENLISMLEKYTSNLEQVVAERTRRLLEEEKKAEALLAKMLPR